MSAYYPKLLHLSLQKSSCISSLKVNVSYSLTLIPVDEVPHLHRLPHTRKFGISTLNTYLVLSQNQVYMQLLSSSKLQCPSPLSLNKDKDLFTDRDPFLGDHTQGFPVYLYARDGVSTSQGNAVKRCQQWARQKDKVISLLIEPYLALLCQTSNLHDLPLSPLLQSCTCIGNCKIKVLCLYFNHKQLAMIHILLSNISLLLDIIQIELLICSCLSAITQLISHSLFPYAPLFPSLTIDISLLDFIKKLFLRLPCNITRQCETLEDFLERQEYRLDSQVSLSTLLRVSLG